MEWKNIEYHYAIKFCVKYNESASETYKDLMNTYGDQPLVHAEVVWWHKAILEERDTFENKPRIGRLVTAQAEESAGTVKRE